MKILLFFLLSSFIVSCSNNLPTKHQETKNGLKFTFEAHHTKNTLDNTRTDVDVELKNVGNDTIYFFIPSCNDWFGSANIDANVGSNFFAIKCPTEGSEINYIAPKTSIKHQFHYSSLDNETFSEFKFGLTCHPVEKNFDLSSDHIDSYLKNQKSITFKPTRVRIQD